jgi:hypothetical protein
MSDDPQSEMERTRLLGEQSRLMKAQQHLERVLGGGNLHDADHEMEDVGPQESTVQDEAAEVMGAGRNMKSESSTVLRTPGESTC